ncbi:MAG: D-alanine--poly(phosphoribitol) ligase subunit 2 [Blautia sp.]|nr:D-alanine--poly(phosphoribitol) ligase subunit 2 [Blautia sp.]
MREKILDILAEVCEDDVVKEDLEMNLFEEGLLDSMGVAQLLMEAEDLLGVVIALTEIQREDIDTPEKIVQLIEERAR